MIEIKCDEMQKIYLIRALATSNTCPFVCGTVKCIDDCFDCIADNIMWNVEEGAK